VCLAPQNLKESGWELDICRAGGFETKVEEKTTILETGADQDWGENKRQPFLEGGLWGRLEPRSRTNILASESLTNEKSRKNAEKKEIPRKKSKAIG